MNVDAIFYDGCLAAIAASERVFLAPEVDALEAGDPWLRMVAAMCLYARDVQRGDVAGPYDHQQAEFYARAVLMPADEFAPLRDLEDADLAARFAVPMAEIARRRKELPRYKRKSCSDEH